MKTKYFVSYAFHHFGNLGFGNQIIEVNKVIQTEDDIAEIEIKIEKESNGMDNPTILFYREIKNSRKPI